MAWALLTEEEEWKAYTLLDCSPAEVLGYISMGKHSLSAAINEKVQFILRLEAENKDFLQQEDPATHCTMNDADQGMSVPSPPQICFTMSYGSPLSQGCGGAGAVQRR